MKQLLAGLLVSGLLATACGGKAEDGAGSTGSGGSGASTGGTASGGTALGGAASGGAASGGRGAALNPAELTPEVCPNVPPCGGDLSGTWKVVDLCRTSTDIPFPIMNCPDAKATWVSTTATGTQSFAADGAVQSLGDAEVVERFDVPLSCMKTTCSEYEANLKTSLSASGALGGGTYEGFSCVVSEQTCVCALTLSSPVDDQGTYSVDGTTLTTNFASGVSVAGYCVQGTRATIVETEGITVLERM